jgi:hypothetical protein
MGGNLAQSCATCGTLLTEGAACAKCGRRDVVIVPAASALRFEVFAPSIIIDGTDPATGDAMIRVSDPGVSSEARRTEGGQVSLNVKGAVNVGRDGEPRALKTFRQKLQADGLVVTISKETDRDKWGEDAILSMGSQRYVVQVVTTPGAKKFWQQARTGSALTQVELQKAVEWLRSSVQAKVRDTSPAERPRTVILVDARHAGHLATPPILESYLSRFSSPAVEFGLAAVWVAGPTVPYCARLGEGTP